jgi:MSHA pilin protein MshA
MMRKQNGFTLIELVVVIIILGILSAVAAPKFVNLQGSARGASLNGLRAAVASASTLANALQTVSGFASNASVTMEGSVVTMSNGYPTANVAGIGSAIRMDAAAYSSAVSTVMTFWVTSASSSSACSFTYSASTGAAAATIGAATTTGC